MVHSNTYFEHFSDIVNTRWRLSKCTLHDNSSLNENPLVAHNDYHHSIVFDKGLLFKNILNSAKRVGAPDWLLLILLTYNLHVDKRPGAPVPGDTSLQVTIDSHMHDLTGTPDLTCTNAHRVVLQVEKIRGNMYGHEIGIYTNHSKFTE